MGAPMKGEGGVVTASSSAADPFGAWEEEEEEEEEVVASSDPIGVVEDATASLIPTAASTVDAVVEKEDIVGGIGAGNGLPDVVAKDDGIDDFGDEWGDDEWGDDVEEGGSASEGAPPPPKMRSANKLTDDSLEAELELDLDDINLDNVDTADLNLSDDLLSD